MTVKELSEIYKIDISGIYRKIKRRYLQLDGHIKIIDGVMQLDEKAIDLLKPQNNNIQQIESLQNELKLQNRKYKNELDECSKQLADSYEDYGKLDRRLYETQKQLDAVIEEKDAIEKKYQTAITRIQELEEKVALLENGKPKGIFGRR